MLNKVCTAGLLTLVIVMIVLAAYTGTELPMSMKFLFMLICSSAILDFFDR